MPKVVNLDDRLIEAMQDGDESARLYLSAHTKAAAWVAA